VTLARVLHVHISQTLGGVLVGALATISASGLQMFGASRIRKADDRATHRSELAGAMREYLTVLDLVVEELRGVPNHPKSRIGSRLDRQLYAIARGTRQQELADRLAAAAAHLRLVAPDDVDELMQKVQAHTRGYEAGDDKWFADWVTLRAEVRDGFKAALAS
jgi:hypothetical protein